MFKLKRRNLTSRLSLLLAIVIIASLITPVIANTQWSKKIVSFEQQGQQNTKTVDTGTTREELALPNHMRALVQIPDQVDSSTFVQVRPPVNQLNGYLAPEDVEVQYDAEEVAVYQLINVASDNLDSVEEIQYRIYGSVSGGENIWFACDEDGNIESAVLDVPVAWVGEYDSETSGEYTLTADCSDYIYAGEYPKAVITVKEEVAEIAAEDREVEESTGKETATGEPIAEDTDHNDEEIIPLAGGSGWEVSYELQTINGGTPPGHYVTNDQLKVLLSFTVPDGQQVSKALLEQSVTIYIQKDFFNVNGGSLGVVNQRIGGNASAPLMFEETSLNQPAGPLVTIDGTQYHPYTIKFNSSDAALAAYSGGDNLRSVSFSMTFTITKSKLTEEEYNSIIVEVEGERVPIIIPGPDPEEPGQPTIQKLVKETYRTDDGGLTYYLVRSYETGGYTPLKGDITSFVIYVRNQDRSPFELDKVVDYLGKGFVILDTTTNTWGDANAWGRAKDIRNLSPYNTNYGNWQLESSDSDFNKYVHTYNPVKTVHPGETVALYMIAYATEDAFPEVGTGLNFENKIDVKNKSTGIKPSNVAKYDLALQTNLTTFTKDSYNAIASDPSKTYLTESTNKNPAHREHLSQDPIPMVYGDGDYVIATYKVIKQGLMSADNVKVVAYIPKGYTVVAEAAIPGALRTATVNNNLPVGYWKYDSNVPNHNNQWSDLTLYTADIPAYKLPLRGDGTASICLVLQVNKQDGYTRKDYSVGGEIYYFTNLAGEVVPDKDSTPDKDPFNDLYGTAIDSDLKEVHNKINGNGLQFWGCTPVNDEDDFDFDYILFAPETEGEGQEHAKLKKRRLNKIDAQNALLKCVRQTTSDYKLSDMKDLAHLVPLGDNEGGSSENQYVAYELLVNWDGSTETLNSVLVDTLPPGLELVTYTLSTNADTRTVRYTAFTIEKVIGNPKDDNGFINHDRVTKGTILYADSLYGADDLRNCSSGFMQNQIRYGIKVVKSTNNRTLTVKFELPGDSSANIYKETKAAYRVCLVAKINRSEIPADLKLVRNEASYTYDEITEKVTEDSWISWNFDANSSYVKKFVDNQGNWLSYPDYAEKEIEADGSVTVKYRIRLRSVGTGSELEIPIGKLNTNDEIPLNASFVGSPVVTGKKDQGILAGDRFGPDGELLDAVDIAASDYKVKAELDGRTLKITNEATPVNQVYYVDFTVKYQDIKQGDVIKNVINGTPVYTITPLKLNLFKKDGADNTPLSDYQFEAYKLDGSGKPDKTQPLLDVDGNPVKFGCTTSNGYSNIVYFVPKDYTPYIPAGQKWSFALVESQSPNGYDGNEGSWCVVTVKSDDAYNLRLDSVTAGEGEATFAHELSTDGGIFFTVSNSKSGIPFEFVKIDERDNPLAGVEFQLYPCIKTHGPGEEHSLLANDAADCCWDIANPINTIITIADGKVSFGSLGTGEYMLVETKTAPGYQLPHGQWLIKVNATSQTIDIEARGETPPAFKKDLTSDAYSLPNHRISILPRAGGFGVILLAIGGVTLIGTAVILSVVIRRRRT